jgi:glycosyltransferase involved in cell wall biosynthesis
MKIAFLTKVVPPVMEGIGEYTFHLVRALRAEGVDAHLFTSDGQQAEESWVHPVIKRWRGNDAAEALRSFGPDWCVFEYAPPLYGPFGFCWSASGIPAALRRKLQCRTAVTFHEFQAAWSLNPLHAALALLLRLQTCRLLKGLDAAIATCPSYAAILRRYAPVPVSIIPVGANVLPSSSSLEKVQELRKKYRLQTAKIITVFGRLSGFRNVKTAVRVLAKAHRKGISSRLLLLGCLRSSAPGIFQELLDFARKYELEPYLIETGNLSTEELSAHLQMTDLFLFPQTDGISTRNTTALSAMAHGIPIVTYEPVPGNFDGYEIPYGAAVPRGDETLFIQAAVDKLQKPEEPVKQYALQYYESHFSWKRVAQLHQRVFEGKPS